MEEDEENVPSPFDDSCDESEEEDEDNAKT